MAHKLRYSVNDSSTKYWGAKMNSKKIAVIVGSLRRESFNKKMAIVLMALAPKELLLELIEIGDLEMYNQDLDDKPPSSWTIFRKHLNEYDGVLFVTPEYNRSVPAVLKNALDVGSRPYGKNVWDGKPGAIVSVSIGAIGGFGANHHLRQMLMYLNVSTMAQPEAYIGDAAKLFNFEGELINDSTRKFMLEFLNAFAVWGEKFQTVGSQAPELLTFEPTETELKVDKLH
jgi:chromate reductase